MPSSILKKGALFLSAAVLAACTWQALVVQVPSNYVPQPAAIGHQQQLYILVKDSRSRGVLDQNAYMPDYPVQIADDMESRLMSTMISIAKARGFNISSSSDSATRYMTVTVNDIHMYPTPDTLQNQTRAEVVITVVAHNGTLNYQRTYKGSAIHSAMVQNTREMNTLQIQQAFEQTIDQIYADTSLWQFLDKSTAAPMQIATPAPAPVAKKVTWSLS